jgi:multiple sugar transport system substrate-binding protein
MNVDSPLSRRTFLKGSAATAAALAVPSRLLLGDERRSASKKTAAASGGALTIAFPGSAEQFNATLKLLAGFTKSTGIKINPISYNTPSGSWVSIFQLLSTRIAGGEPLDSAYIATEGMLLFEEQNLLDPLDSYIAADKTTMNAFYKDVNPNILQDFQKLDNIHGHTYFVPIGYNVMSIWYNRKLFKQFNVPEPAAGWTWDEFESAASKIASPPNRYGFAIGSPVPGPFTDVYPWVLTNGGYILNPAQSTCVAGSAASIEAASFVRSLVTKKLVNEPGGSYNAGVKAYAGDLAMFGGGMWPNLYFGAGIPQSSINETFGIVPWPKSTTNGTPVGVGGFPMFTSCKNKEAMWEFIKFSLSPEFQTGPVVPFGGDMPIRLSVGTDPSWLAQWPEGTHNFTTELAYATMIVGVPNATAVESEISNVWEEILTGAVSPATGMKNMESQCNTLMAEKIG